MGQSDRNRRFSVIAIRADGRHVPVTLSSDVEVSIIGKLELLLLGLLALITGSRWEPGDRRR
jgi:hypothetical protein